MELTRRQITELSQAHASLDGSKEGTYKFSAKTRYSLAKNLRLLRGKAMDINKVQNDFIRERVPHGTEPPKSGTAEFEKLDKELTAFQEETESIPGLMKFPLADLQLDLNPIPVTVLCYLGPIIVEDVA